MTNEQRQEELEALKEKDIKYNWVKSSRLLFYLALTAFICFVAGCSYNLYTNHYKGKPDIDIQSSTKYVPEYK